MRGDGLVGGFERRPGEHLRCDRGDHREQFGLHGVAAEPGRDRHEGADELRVADGELDRHTAAHAEADDVGLRDAEVPEERRGVVGHALVGERAVGVGGAAVGLGVGNDDATARGEAGQQRAEVSGGHVRAVEQQDGSAAVRAVDLVVHLQAVDGSETGIGHTRHPRFRYPGVSPGTMATFIDCGSRLVCSASSASVEPELVGHHLGERVAVGVALQQPQRRPVAGARVVGQPDEADVLAADVPVHVEADLAGVGEVAHLQHHPAPLEHLDALDERRRCVRHVQHDSAPRPWVSSRTRATRSSAVVVDTSRVCSAPHRRAQASRCSDSGPWR